MLQSSRLPHLKPQNSKLQSLTFLRLIYLGVTILLSLRHQNLRFLSSRHQNLIFLRLTFLKAMARPSLRHQNLMPLNSRHLNLTPQSLKHPNLIFLSLRLLNPAVVGMILTFLNLKLPKPPRSVCHPYLPLEVVATALSLTKTLNRKRYGMNVLAKLAKSFWMLIKKPRQSKHKPEQCEILQMTRRKLQTRRRMMLVKHAGEERFYVCVLSALDINKPE
mmetsp:Transcript_28691/g.43358  ORF Transcript_28691/g.43358 Transcript_28691/m.43358 type:complete len:219 (-) Transcript_28691:241-897(-)